MMCVEICHMDPQAFVSFDTGSTAFGSRILGHIALPSLARVAGTMPGSGVKFDECLEQSICRACDKALQKAAVSMRITGSKPGSK